MKMSVLKYFLTTVMLLTTTIQADEAECNQFANSDFENGIDLWDEYSESVRVSYTSYSGKNAIVYKNGGFGQDMNNLPEIDGKTPYILEGYYKNRKKPDSIALGMVYFDEDWEVIKEEEISLEKSNNYKKFSLNTTPPEGTAHASFWAWSDSSNGAKTYFDKLNFQAVNCSDTPVTISACNVLQNSGFDVNAKSWTLYGDTRQVEDAHSGEMALEIKNGGLDQTSIRLEAKKETYQFNGYYKTTGETDGIWVGMVFLDEDKEFLFERSFFLKDRDTYTKFVLNATASEDTRYIEAWIWSSAEENSGKIILDDLKVSSSGCYDYTIPSSLPPKGLSPSEVPQFVVIGFDDNVMSDGISWALDLFYNKHNQDGSKARVSFYMNTTGLYKHVEDDPEKLVEAVQRLKNTSHEIGNHTDNHHSNLDGNSAPVVLLDHNIKLTSIKNDMPEEKKEELFFDRIKKLGRDAWQERIVKASNDLMRYTNVHAYDIKGFRSPYLLYNQNSMSVLNGHNFLYDCSIEEGYAPEFDGTNFRWPYQLNDGSPGHNESWYGNNYNDRGVEIDNIKGLWELPMYVLMVPTNSECRRYGIKLGLWSRLKDNLPYLEDHKITGLDYNLWSEGQINKEEMLGILKYNLDLRLNGNRAPFMFGAHSQYYTEEWADENAPNADVDEMREAISEFVEYALSKKDVRIKPSSDIIKWCKNPRAIR